MEDPKQKAPFAPETASGPVVAEAPKKPAEVERPGEGTVTMSFPRAVRLTTIDGPVEFPQGIQEVPVHLADHPYLRHSGATRYNAGQKLSWEDATKPAEAQQSSVTQRHADFLQARGYDHIKDTADAQRFFDGLRAEHKQSFLDDARKWFSEHGTDQATLQRQVQDKASGAKDPAPPNPKQKEGGPDPKNVRELAEEGKVVSPYVPLTTQVGGGKSPSPSPASGQQTRVKTEDKK